jgi:hypothetical protein
MQTVVIFRPLRGNNAATNSQSNQCVSIYNRKVQIGGLSGHPKESLERPLSIFSTPEHDDDVQPTTRMVLTTVIRIVRSISALRACSVLQCWSHACNAQALTHLSLEIGTVRGTVPNGRKLRIWLRWALTKEYYNSRLTANFVLFS